MKIQKALPQSREVLNYRYLDKLGHLTGILTVDKKTGDFINFDTFTAKKQAAERFEFLKLTEAINKLIPSKTMITRYLQSDGKTLDFIAIFKKNKDGVIELVNSLNAR